MSVTLDQGKIRLSGCCTAEDAELLLKHLVEGRTEVDISGCDSLHAAIVQLLIAAQPTIVGEPAGFVRDWLMPIIRGGNPG